MAPGANIVYVGVESCHDVDLARRALNDLVDEHLADIVSNS